MKIAKIHEWDINPKDAIKLQKQLAAKIIKKCSFEKIESIAGADISFDEKRNHAIAGVILYSYPDLEEAERTWVELPVSYPYIPGLLSFREAPALLKAFSQLKHRCDCALFDGQGIAHPRRLGLASHMGIWLNIPTIGCAKSRLTGTYDEPGTKKGDFSLLHDDGEEIGAALRTRDNTRPIFVSIGHMIDLKRSIEIVLNSLDKTRIPKPTREADRFVAMMKSKDACSM